QRDRNDCDGRDTPLTLLRLFCHSAQIIKPAASPVQLCANIEVMDWKDLVKSERPACSACEPRMIPSIYDLQTFCHGNPEECLVYQTKESNMATAIQVSDNKKKWSEAV